MQAEQPCSGSDESSVLVFVEGTQPVDPEQRQKITSGLLPANGLHYWLGFPD
jgi:hypothetical protein